MLARANSGSEDDFQLSLLPIINVLLEIEDYEAAIALANRINETSSSYGPMALAGIPATLVEKEEDALAWSVLDTIQSPYTRATALSSMSSSYQLLEQSDRALDVAAQALALVQATDFSDDLFVIMLLEAYDEAGYFAQDDQFADDQLDLEKQLRENVIQNIIWTFYESPEQLQVLLPLIEDDELRSQLSAEVSVDEMLSEFEQGSEAAFEARRTAYDAADEGNFPTAIEAISRLDSPLEQSRVLLTIAKCYVGSNTVADAETLRWLQQIQQQAD